MKSYFAESINTLTAPTWKIWLAKVFGKKSVGVDSGCKVTCYKLNGIIYVTDVKQEKP